MIRQFLKAAGINRVIWVDDFFAPASRDALEDALRQRFFRMKGERHPGFEVNRVGKIDLTLSLHEIEERCDQVFSALSDEEIRVVAHSLDISDEAIDNLAEDLPRESFKALQTAFGSGLQTFSLAEWTSEASGKFKSAGSDTLFLIDKQFTREKAAYDGLYVLRDLIRSDAFCILLTHTCSENEQNAERINIARQSAGELPAYRFSVLSKQPNGEDGVEQLFARGIHAVLTHRFTGEIAETLRKAIETSAKITAEKLTNQSVFELDVAFFENSHTEGVPEFDVLVRIFNIEQRHAVNAFLRENTLQSQLRRARKFRKDTASFRGQWPRPHLNMQEFREWRRREVFEDGLGLNAIHAPLACGDVFEVGVERKKTKYVFLAQPCDLMIRREGRRNAEMGLFVLVIESGAGARQEDLSGHRFFDISGVFGVEDDWRLDFRNTVVVDISVVDLAVFNADGAVQLEKNHADPQILLPPGWLSRLQRAKKQFFERPQDLPPPSLAMGRFAKTMEGNLTGDLARYPVRRIGRLEGNTATAILAAWATFQTRAALEHDFAFKKIEETKES